MACNDPLLRKPLLNGTWATSTALSTPNTLNSAQDPLNNPPPDTLYSALGPEMADLLVEHIRSSPSPSHLAAARSPSTPGTSPFGAAPSAPGVQGILAGDTAQAMEESLERLRRENAELRAQLERMERGATAASRAGGGGDREGARAGTGTLSEQMVPPLHVGESAAGTGGTGTGRAVVGEERPHTALGRLQALQGERWDRHGGPQRMTKSVVGEWKRHGGGRSGQSCEWNEGQGWMVALKGAVS